MLVSIIILNYNTFELTCSCIRSIYEETKNVDFEIIVVDNASTLDEPDKFLALFPKIKLIKNKENRGFAGGCNDGIKVAKGDTILLLNSDTKLLNDAITITYNFLKTHPEVGIATCRLENTDGSPQSNCQPFPSIKLMMLEYGRIHKLFGKRKRSKIWMGPYFSYDTTLFPDWIWGTFFMFPRMLLKIFPENKLPETFWMYVEDMEWCWLAHKAGYKIAFVHEGKVLHLGGVSSRTTDIKMNMMSENFKKFYTIYYGKIYSSILLWLLNVLNNSKLHS